MKPYQQNRRTQGLRTGEYRAASRGEGWKFQLIIAIKEVMKRAGTREEFLREMKQQGYQVRWEEGRKSITYTTPTGKKCRDDKLHELKFRKEQLAVWLARADKIHREICQDLRQTVSEMKEEGRQAGKQREEFMRRLSELEEQFRRNWDNASAHFQGKILLTLLSSGILSAAVSVLMWRLLL